MKPFNEEKALKRKDLKIGDWGFHGDVFFEVVKPTKGFDSMQELEEPVLAYGEATGHLHKIIGDPKDFSLRECPKTKTKYLRVVKNAVLLKHQEHRVEEFTPGDYKIGIQREYDPWSKQIRRVAD